MAVPAPVPMSTTISPDDILSAVAVGVLVVDDTGAIHHTSRPCIDLLGLDRAQLEGQQVCGALGVPEATWQDAASDADLMGEATLERFSSPAGIPLRATLTPMWATGGPSELTVVTLQRDRLPPVTSQLSSAVIDLHGRAMPTLRRARQLLARSARELSHPSVRRALDVLRGTAAQPAWDVVGLYETLAREIHPKAAAELRVEPDETVPHAFAPPVELAAAAGWALLANHRDPSASTTLQLHHSLAKEELTVVLEPALHSGTPSPALSAVLEQGGGSVCIDPHGALRITFPARLEFTADGVAPRPQPAVIDVEQAVPEPTPGPAALLVEPDMVSGLIAEGRLRGLGLQVHIAEDAASALKAASTRHHELAVISFDSPVIDGPALVAALRALPASLRPAHIAATYDDAAPRQGSVRRGGPAVDSVLERPLQQGALHAVVDRLNTTERPSATPTHAPDDDLPVLDAAIIATLASFDTEGTLVNEVLGTFLDDIPPSQQILTDAFSQGDLETVRRTAHRLKGAAATVGAARIEAMCATMEEAARAGEEDVVTPLIDQLAAEADRVQVALTDRYV